MVLEMVECVFDVTMLNVETTTFAEARDVLAASFQKGQCYRSTVKIMCTFDRGWLGS